MGKQFIFRAVFSAVVGYLFTAIVFFSRDANAISSLIEYLAYILVFSSPFWYFSAQFQCGELSITAWLRTAFLELLILLLLTVPLTVTLFILGCPELGLLISGYLGLFLLGSLIISLVGFVRSLPISNVTAFLSHAGTLILAWQLGKLLPLQHFVTLQRGILQLSDISFFIFLTVFFLFLCYQIRAGIRKRWQRVSVIAGSLLLLQFGSYYLPLEWDMTRDKFYTLSPQTRLVLKQLRSPVVITAFISEKTYEGKIVSCLLRTYARHSAEIEFREMPFFRKKQDVVHYGIREFGAVVFESKNKRRDVPHDAIFRLNEDQEIFQGEQVFTDAIHAVSTESKIGKNAEMAGSIGVSAKIIPATTLTLSRKSAFFFALFCLVLWPVGVAILGCLDTWRRKRNLPFIR